MMILMYAITTGRKDYLLFKKKNVNHWRGYFLDKTCNGSAMVVDHKHVARKHNEIHHTSATTGQFGNNATVAVAKS